MNDGLKQRVIGALVLAGIAVIFLPDFFKEQQLHQVDTRTQIPAKPAMTPVVIETPRPIIDEPLPDPDHLYLPESDQPVAEDLSQLQAANEASVAASSERAAASAQPVAQSTSSQPSSLPRPESSSSSPSQLSSSAPEELNAWVVQVASLRSSESAQRLRKQLQDRGYKAYVRQAQTGQGEVSRVFIGPKLDKALAETVKNEVDPVFKVNSLVLRFKP
ncbi:SPOR domain-containing protein [Gilvimarinus sp. SDUM040013]|uniref:SPOR domain-containing protein n=1 Tax=Gilvimarinus gilvus TaxID=3058038 RepID=A0ABU4RZV6_9GAMM|nr:SPOR domain-containing protein [Gilvimarinus sp. SDUM040013]MDO3386435.1 SPOR domain-containing protein [Gilvimarinus sp. SDUM040013]MDX6849701.1 SPOR domain-containing protein [Gilvimarinus sp. SDUM040013]